MPAQSVSSPQAGDSPLRCGLYCLYITLKSFEKGPASLPELEETVGLPPSSGYSLLTLKEAAVAAGLNATCVNTTLELLQKRHERLACIAHVQRNHFVLLAGVENDEVIIIDPPTAYRLPVKTFLSRWKGEVLLLSPEPLQSEESLSRQVRFYAILIRCAYLSLCVLLGVVLYIQVRKRRYG